MPRPRSNTKRSAILSAATRVIVAQGLAAPTAGIAKEAGIANGSLFTYFATKMELFNALYLELKTEMACAAMLNLPKNGPLRDQLFHVWQNWMEWSLSFPEKRRVLAQLDTSDDITAVTRSAASQALAGAAEIVKHIHSAGSMRETPIAFILTLTNALAEATMHFIAEQPTHAKQHCRNGFEAVWKMLA